MADTTTLRLKLALLCASTCVSVIVGLVAYHAFVGRPGTVLEVDRREEISALLDARADRRAWTLSQEGYPPALVRSAVDAEAAKPLFSALTYPMFKYDSLLYFKRASNFSMEVQFPERSPIPYHLTTNDYGFRNDENVRKEKPDLRVLVTGDSHTDGVCTNAESFTGVLGDLLRRSRPTWGVESLNAGLGFYNPYNYLGVIERYGRELRPDVFVVTVYGGNDFHEMMLLQRYFNHRPAGRAGPRLDRYVEHLRQHPDGPRGEGAQDLTQVVYFLGNPDDVQIAIDTAASISLEIARICREEGIGLLFVYLPPASSVQFSAFAEQYGVALDLLGIAPAQMAVSERLADGWLAFLRERHLAHLDLRPLFRRARVPYYWRKDLHLNVAGHRAVAETLEPLVEALSDHAARVPEQPR